MLEAATLPSNSRERATADCSAAYIGSRVEESAHEMNTGLGERGGKAALQLLREGDGRLLRLLEPRERGQRNPKGGFVTLDVLPLLQPQEASQLDGLPLHPLMPLLRGMPP